MKPRETQRRNHRATLPLLVCLITLCAAVDAHAWWNYSWGRRVLITITNTGGALSNYQVQVNVTYDSDMQSDFDDIRFVNSDDKTEMDYWRESYTASTSAIFWVEVPSIPAASSKTIVMYYNNAGVSTTSSGPNTFDYYVDFESGEGFTPTGDVNGKGTPAWVAPITAGNFPSLITSGSAFSGSQQLESRSDTGSPWCRTSKVTLNLGGDRLIDFRFQLIDDGTAQDSDASFAVVDSSDNYSGVWTRPIECGADWCVGTPGSGTGDVVDTNIAYTYSYVRMQIGICGTSNTMNAWIGGSQVVTNTNQSLSGFQRIEVYTDQNAGYRADLVFIRKLACTLPTLPGALCRRAVAAAERLPHPRPRRLARGQALQLRRLGPA